LELMVARILVPESDESERGALARVERLERRIGVDGAPAVAEPRAVPKVAAPAVAPKSTEPQATPKPAEPSPVEAVAEAKTVTIQQMRDSWPEILEVVKENRNAWMVVYTSQARSLDGEVLTVTFPNESDVASFKKPQGPGESVSEILRSAILAVLGLRVKFIAKVEPTLAAIAEETALADAVPVDEAAPEQTEPDAEPAVDAAGWAVAEIPGATNIPATPSAAAKPLVTKPLATKPATGAAPKAATSAPEPQRYGESVVREILGASFIEEQAVAPRVTPREN
ncbi:MAG TPA: hypothetical protein VK537_04780, partial [Galbitalea sp.]|nr:hypothetical protein [Galbitalea sp.]